jgi:RHS repeat-associated protein
MTPLATMWIRSDTSETSISGATTPISPIMPTRHRAKWIRNESFNGLRGRVFRSPSGFASGVGCIARHYNPQTGTFLQADPLPAQEGTPDTNYSYAGNDPVNKVDPEGMTSVRRGPKIPTPQQYSRRTVKIRNTHPQVPSLGFNHIWRNHTYRGYPLAGDPGDAIYRKSKFVSPYAKSKSNLRETIAGCLNVFTDWYRYSSNATNVVCIAPKVGYTEIRPPASNRSWTDVFMVSVIGNTVANAFPVGHFDTRGEPVHSRIPIAVGHTRLGVQPAQVITIVVPA